MENNGFLGSVVMLLKSRKEVVFAISWTAALATIIAGRGVPPITVSFLSIIAFLMVNLSVYIYNDVVDRDMDAFSELDKKKGRPIAHGKVSVTDAMRFVYLTGLLGLGFCLLINTTVFSIGLTYYILLFLYSYPGVRFKKMYLIKNIVTSLIMPVAFLIGGVAVENKISISTSFLAIAYFILSFMVLPALADMLDFEEDRAFNIKTLGNTLTWKQNLILFNIGIITIIISGVISYQMFNISYYVSVILSVIGIPAMIYSYKLRNENGVTASVKLRPVGFGLVMMTPLILALGVLF